MRKLSPKLLAWTACALILGCAPEKRRTGSNGLGVALERLVAAHCERMLECPSGELQVGTAEACARDWGAMLCTNSATLAEADVSRCERAMREQVCDEVFREDWPAGCEAVFRRIVQASKGWQGVGSEGDPCESEIHCSPELRCEAGDRGLCPGRCAARAALGEHCLNSADCVSGAFCSRERVCQARRALGETCNGLWECAEACAGGRCVTLREVVGQACTGTEDCAIGLRCMDATCRPHVAEGARCKDHGDCQAGTACREGECVLASACGAGVRGDPCMDSGQCAGALVCARDQRRCEEPTPRGRACELSGVPCARGDVCAEVSLAQPGVCGPPDERANGAACSLFFECKSGFCRDGHCAPLGVCDSP